MIKYHQKQLASLLTLIVFAAATVGCEDSKINVDFHECSSAHAGQRGLMITCMEHKGYQFNGKLGTEDASAIRKYEERKPTWSQTISIFFGKLTG